MSDDNPIFSPYKLFSFFFCQDDQMIFFSFDKSPGILQEYIWLLIFLGL